MTAVPMLNFRTTNSLWSSVLVETLVRLGVRQAVISPGSRSTPLTLAFALHPSIEAVPVLDERSAAFFALGLAKQKMLPVVLVCTSGTAAANYFPAIIEARESGVPLLVISADRPPEMRACASGQTIDQQKIFGAYVGFYHELSAPEASEAMLRYLRQTVAHAVERTTRPFFGPVHLNAPFRDPLVPIDDGGATARIAQPIDWERFFGHLQLVSPAMWGTVSRVPQLVPESHGVIVVGPEVGAMSAESLAKNVGQLARQLGWPVISDGLSSLRNFAAHVPHLVTTADTLLRNPGIAERLKPECVIAIGSWPTSKVIRQWIESSQPQIFLWSNHPENRDALHGRTQHFQNMEALLQLAPTASGPSGYERLWVAAEQKTRAALNAKLADIAELFEGKSAWLLAQHLPPQAPVFVANSMPVRDVEYFWPPNDRGAVMRVNRGANGIDGTLSSALGAAHGGAPAVLLTGDLALLHDTNGFLLCPKFRGSLTIVLINNRGGGIFEHLPVAQFGQVFEEFFATPQEADFTKLCAAYSVDHTLILDWTQFTALISTLPTKGIRMLEIRTDRKRDTQVRKQLFAAVAASL